MTLTTILKRQLRTSRARTLLYNILLVIIKTELASCGYTIKDKEVVRNFHYRKILCPRIIGDNR